MRQNGFVMEFVMTLCVVDGVQRG